MEAKKAKSAIDLHTLRAADARLDALAEHIQNGAADGVAASVGDLGGALPARILVTGSSGYIGSALVRALRKAAISVVGLDVITSSTTDIVGSVSDEAILAEAAHDCGAIIHTAALHAPHAETHDEASYRNVNIEGTRCVLAVAKKQNGKSALPVVFSSTTSLTITPHVKSQEADGSCVLLSNKSTHPAENITDEQFLPRNKYGRTKLAAEKLCIEAAADQPIVILRVSRCFPEDVIDTSERSTMTLANFKANELLGRRVGLQDVVDAHLRAVIRAQKLTGQILTLAAPFPFSYDSVPTMGVDFPKCINDELPQVNEVYAAQGWSLPAAITRVYDSSDAVAALEWKPRWTFKNLLALLGSEGAGAGRDDATLGRF